MRTRIYHERRIELALEGQRYFDLKRWRLDRVIIPTIKDPSGAYRTFPLRDTLWPVPQSEIDIANSYGNTGVTQTAGYVYEEERAGVSLPFVTLSGFKPETF